MFENLKHVPDCEMTDEATMYLKELILKTTCDNPNGEQFAKIIENSFKIGYAVRGIDSNESRT